MRARRLPDVALVAAVLAGAPLVMASGVARAEEPGPPGGGGAIRISPEPSRLLLGRDAGADLRITAPADVEDVSLSASVGRIEGLRRLPGGGFAARWRVPAERYPQVAIVAALGRTPHGAEHGWVAIPLSGQGDARVRAAPGQEITLQIGERKFGPRRAGSDGLAVIPVVVPPGVREAHHGFTPIDLHVPETQLLHAVLDRGVVFADRQERVRVFAYVVAPHGAARRGDVPVFEASRGSVSAAEREPGLMEGVWTLPPGRAGEERLVVRLAAAPASRSVLKLEAVAGPPAGVAVAFDRDALVAGGEAVTVTARALDAAGNLVPAALTLAAEGGELAGVRERETGEVEARVRAGPAFGGRRELRVTASALGIGISGARELALRPGEAAAARFEDADVALRGDGARAEVLRVSVADRHGNPVDVAPAVTAERGKVLGIAARSPGTFEVRYVPPAVKAAARERLVATIGSVRATASPLLLPSASGVETATWAGAVLDLRGRFAGPRAGVAIQRPVETVLAPGLGIAWRAEVEGLGFDGEGRAAVLGGLAFSDAVDASAILRASLTAGALLGGGGTSAAARLALGVGVPGRTLRPFVEVAVLAARDGAPGAFAAIGVTAGMRVGLGR